MIRPVARELLELDPAFHTQFGRGLAEQVVHHGRAWVEIPVLPEGR